MNVMRLSTLNRSRMYNLVLQVPDVDIEMHYVLRGPIRSEISLEARLKEHGK